MSRSNSIDEFHMISLIGVADAARTGNLRLVARAVGSEFINVTEGIVNFSIKLIAVKGECIQIEEESELPRDGTFELIVSETEVGKCNVFRQSPWNVSGEVVGGEVNGGQVGVKTSETNGNAAGKLILRHIYNRQVVATLKDIRE